MNHKLGTARVWEPRISVSILIKRTKTNVESAEVQSLDLDVNCEVDTLSIPQAEKKRFSYRIEGISMTDVLVGARRACCVVKKAFVTESNKMISVNRFDKR